jgi:magnesium chelatase subunit I
VDVKTPQDLALRVQVVRRRDAYERDPSGFRAEWDGANRKLRQRIVRAQKAVAGIDVDDALLLLCATLCHQLGTDGLRAELTLLRATRAYAALMGDKAVNRSHLRAMAPLVLRHRLRRNPLDDTGSGVRVQRAMDEVMAA